MHSKKGFAKIMALAAIYSLPLLTNGGFLMTPALDSIAKAFPNEPYSSILLIYTLPNLIALPFILISGRVVGNKLPYKPTLLAVIATYTISGVAPFFLNRLILILLCRVVFGICLGILGPQGNALILRFFEGEERNRYLGYSIVVIGFAGVTYQFLAGCLCPMGWNYVFLGYFIGLLPIFIISFFFVEPDRVNGEDNTAPVEAKSGEIVGDSGKVGSKKEILILFLLIFVIYVCGQAKTMVISSVVASEGMGDAVVSARILTMSTAGSILGGVMMPVFLKKVKRYRVSVLILIMAITSLFILVNNPYVIGLGVCLDTAAFMTNLGILTIRASKLFDASESGKAVGLVQCGDKCGSFAATYFAAFGSVAAATFGYFSRYRYPAVLSSIIFVILAVLDAVHNGPTEE